MGIQAFSRSTGAARFSHYCRAMLPRDDLRPPVSSTDGVQKTPRIVLVVDGDANTLECYDRWLRAAGFWVARAGDAFEAFEYALDVRPDAVVVQLALPGAMHGADLIREIHGDSTLRGLPVLAVRGLDPADDPGVDGITIAAVLTKPVAPDALIEQLNDAIAQADTARARSSAALDKVPSPLPPRRLSRVQRVFGGGPAREKKHRCCPSCDEKLQWIESNRLRGVTFDYYRWCANGCGLYCFNRSTGRFEVLDVGTRSVQPSPL